MSKRFDDIILDELETLKDSLMTTNDSLEFIKYFLSHQTANSLEDINDMDIVDFMICYILTNSDGDNFQIIRTILNNNSSFLQSSKYDDLQDFINASIVLNNKFAEQEDLSYEERLNIVNNYFRTKYPDIAEYYEEDNEFLDFIELLNNDVVVDALEAVKQVKELRFSYSCCKDAMVEVKDLVNVKAKKEQNMFKTFLANERGLGDVLNYIKDIETYYNDTKNKIEKNNRKVGKQAQKYLAFLDLYKKEIEKEEMTRIDDLMSYLPDKLKEELVKEIYDFNQPVYDKLDREYEKLSADYKNQVKLVLKNAGLDPEAFDYKRTIEIEDLKESISIIKNLKIKDNNKIIEILNKSNIERIRTLYDLITSGVLTPGFITNNLELFNTKTTKGTYNRLITNINIVSTNGINPTVFITNPEMLLTEEELFKENIEYLKSSQLTDLRSTSNLSFISDPNLISKIDTIFELGFEDLATSNLSILNFNENLWQKVIIAKSIGDEVNSIEDLEKLNNQNFNGLECCLDEYIYNYISSLSEEEKSIKVDLNSVRRHYTLGKTYNIEGILISKPKLERKVSEKGYLTLEDITDNSVLSEEEYKMLKSSLLSSKEI